MISKDSSNVIAASPVVLEEYKEAMIPPVSDIFLWIKNEAC